MARVPGVAIPTTDQVRDDAGTSVASVLRTLMTTS